MSNLPGLSAGTHNDDHDESSQSGSIPTTQNNKINTKFSNVNGRITSPRIIKHQQTMETKIANNQAYDEVHDVQSKPFSLKKTKDDEEFSNLDSSHELMQSNYYDQARFDPPSSPSTSKVSSERGCIDINVEYYKKTIAPVSTSKKNSSPNQTGNRPPFGDTSESIQQGIATSAGILLELNRPSADSHLEALMNTTDQRPISEHLTHPDEHNAEDEDLNKERSPSSTDGSTSDSSNSNKPESKSAIPYEKLLDEDDDTISEPTKKSLTEATTLLNKNSQTYGTQSTASPGERSKCLATNGYNSHGSSITTKSSSDNSGSVRTNSGSDNDEESDEEHYNNSTLANTSHPMPIYSRSNDSSTKMFNKSDHHGIQRYADHVAYLNDPNSVRAEQMNPRDEQHLQVPRLKQFSLDDPNDNTNKKLDSSSDYTTLPYSSKWSSQALGNNPASSSHPNRSQFERHEQTQADPSNPPRSNARQPSARATKRRKQSQQQDVIRTESIPGHRGDLDVDELVMFIGGNSSKQRQNSTETRANSKISAVADSNSNRTTARKKSRRTMKNQLSTDDREQSREPNEATSVEPNHPSVDDDPEPIVSHSTVDQADPSHSLDLSQPETIDRSVRMNGHSSSSSWFERSSIPNDDEVEDDSFSRTAKLAHQSNSGVISEPFVTVKNRRRSVKERREETYHYVPQSTRYTVNSTFNNNNDKRRISSTSQHDPIRSSPRNSLSNIKPTVTSMTKEKSPVPAPLEPVLPALSIPAEKVPSPPRLSSHSSSSSLGSLLKRQTKPPPVVFLNKSINVELNDVSFGFDIDPITEKISSEPVDSPTDKEPIGTNPSTPPPAEAAQLDEVLTDFVAVNVHERTFQQRHTRDPRFYSGSDIRPPHRAYASVPMSSAPFMDPLLLQYNQQRFPNYSQPLSYMNLLRTPYLPSQAQYLLVPTSYPSAAPNEMDSDEKSLDGQTSQPAEQVQEPLLVYTNIPNQSGPMYFHPSANKSSFIDPKQGLPAAVSNMYPSAMAMYPPPMFYPRPAQHLYPSSAAYFQPISSPSLFVDTKLDERQNIDPAETSGKYGQTADTLPSASSDIMSSALQLVYSQQRRNAQTDRFNLDDLTAYLAMKWTETVDHYEQGDCRVLLIDRQD